MAMNQAPSEHALSDWQIALIDSWIEARKNAEMTQQQVATALGMHEDTIENFEIGIALPSVHTLRRFAKLTDTKLRIIIDPLPGEPVGPFERLLKKIGLYITQLRARDSLTQEDLAPQCGMPADVLSAIERGQHNLDLEDLCLIANGFGVTPHEFIREAELIKLKRNIIADPHFC